MEVVDIGIPWHLGQPQIGAAGEKDGQRQTQFQPRQGGADAKMHACAKAGVGFDAAGWVKYMRIVPHTCIAVGHRQQKADLIAALQGTYGEAAEWFGIADGGVVEIWTNEATGTWTALVHLRRCGNALLVARRDRRVLGHAAGS